MPVLFLLLALPTVLLATTTAEPLSRRWLTITEASDYLGVVPLTVRRQISRGELRGYKIRGVRAVRVDRHELDALLKPIPAAGGDRRAS